MTAEIIVISVGALNPVLYCVCDKCRFIKPCSVLCVTSVGLLNLVLYCVCDKCRFIKPCSILCV